MAEQSSSIAEAACLINSVLSNTKAVNPRLDADCTSSLCVSDLKTAWIMLRPLFVFSDRLIMRQSVRLDEAMVYLHKARSCELLLSLLRRWPWAEMRQDSD